MGDPQRMVALAGLELFPPSIRETLISNPKFLRTYGFETDAKLSFGDSGVSVPRAALFDAIREILDRDDAAPTIEDTTGCRWSVELDTTGDERRVALVRGERRLLLPQFWCLSPSRAERLNGFDQEADAVCFAGASASKWRTVLAGRALTDDEVAAFHTDLNETPTSVARVISAELDEGSSKLSSLVPRSRRYFERLVGKFQPSQNITDYAAGSGRDHIRGLISWRPYEGLLLALLMSSHSSLVTAIDVSDIGDDDIMKAYQWLTQKGDRISQVGAIELGLSVLDRFPVIEPALSQLIEQLRDDDPDDREGRLRLLSALIVLVEGELARTKVLAGTPPFWRRLASMAQASLIERSIIASEARTSDFCDWAIGARGQTFYLQSMADLRLEPRWLPDLVSAKQLKLEFVGRVFNSAHQNISIVQGTGLREVLLDESPKSLRSLVEFPFSFLPGPLEGGLQVNVELPPEIESEMEARLRSGSPEQGSFAALVNSGLLYRLDSQHAELAAKALREAKHHVRGTKSDTGLFSLLSGLAVVAAVTRSSDLADELKILTRRGRHLPQGLPAEEAVRIGLVAAAAHTNPMSWCKFVVEWITELAFQPLTKEEAEKLQSHLAWLCHIVPELWAFCGSADAALRAAVRP